MAAVTSIHFSVGYGSSFSGTLNLPGEALQAVAQVALTSVAVDQQPGSVQISITGYSSGGNPVDVTDGSVVLAINNADSFTFYGSTFNARAIASIMVYSFE
jgi:hypothetical protein